MAITKNGSTPQFVNASLVPAAGISVLVPAGVGAAEQSVSINLPSGIYATNASGTVNGALKINGTAVVLGANRFTEPVTSISVLLSPTWTTRTADDIGDNTINVLTSAPTLTQKFIFATNVGRVNSSTDGITWTRRTWPITFGINGVASNASVTEKYVFVADGATAASSTDGITWVTRTIPGALDWKGIAAHPDLTIKYFVISQATTGGADARSSTDGITWVSRTTNISGGSANRSVFISTTLTEKYFVTADSSGNLKSSTDGITWVTRTPNAANALNGGVEAPSLTNRLLVVGNSGIARTSTDGITWTTRTISGNTNWEGVGKSASGGYIVVASSGQLATSTDGTTWTLRNSATTSTLRRVASTDDINVVIGESATIRTATTDAGITNGDFFATILGPIPTESLS